MLRKDKIPKKVPSVPTFTATTTIVTAAITATLPAVKSMSTTYTSDNTSITSKMPNTDNSTTIDTPAIITSIQGNNFESDNNKNHQKFSSTSQPSSTAITPLCKKNESTISFSNNIYPTINSQQKVNVAHKILGSDIEENDTDEVTTVVVANTNPPSLMQRKPKFDHRRRLRGVSEKEAFNPDAIMGSFKLQSPRPGNDIDEETTIVDVDKETTVADIEEETTVMIGNTHFPSFKQPQPNVYRHQRFRDLNSKRVDTDADMGSFKLQLSRPVYNPIQGPRKPTLSQKHKSTKTKKDQSHIPKEMIGAEFGKKGEIPKDVEFREINQETLTKKTREEEQLAKFEENFIQPDVQVTSQFWNARTGKFQTNLKPTKLHKRKHQINQLAHEAAAREFELAKKRAHGYKTRRETQLKYGW